MNTTETQTQMHRSCYEKYIIREATYRQQGDNLGLIKINPDHHEQIRSSILQAVHIFSSSPSSPSSTSSTLGHLDILPLEILHEICHSLDIASLFTFRQTNSRANQVVCSLRIYQMAMPHASEVLSAIMKTNTVPWLTLNDLLDLVVTQNCKSCGNSVGGFIFLPSMVRWRFWCVDTNPTLYEYLVRLFWPDLRYSAPIRKMFHGLNLAGEWCVDCSGRETWNIN